MAISCDIGKLCRLLFPRFKTCSGVKNGWIIVVANYLKIYMIHFEESFFNSQQFLWCPLSGARNHLDMALIPCILRSSSSIQSKRTTTLATEFCWDRLSSHSLDKWKVAKMGDPQNHGLQILNIDKYRIYRPFWIILGTPMTIPFCRVAIGLPCALLWEGCSFVGRLFMVFTITHVDS